MSPEALKYKFIPNPKPAIPAAGHYRFPAWVNALEKLPKSQSIGGAIVATFVLTGLVTSIIKNSYGKYNYMVIICKWF